MELCADVHLDVAALGLFQLELRNSGSRLGVLEETELAHVLATDVITIEVLEVDCIIV
tara:strand:+ start:177 stop:350 length:174 start_codon:yes stop_codon:yes gene_type:complete